MPDSWSTKIVAIDKEAGNVITYACHAVDGRFCKECVLCKSDPEATDGSRQMKKKKEISPIIPLCKISPIVFKSVLEAIDRN